MNISLLANTTSYVFAAITLLMLAACNSDETRVHTVTSQDKAGTVTVAVTLIAPWEDYADALTPHFDLKPAGALTEVMRTSSVISHSLSRRVEVEAELRRGLAKQQNATESAKPPAQEKATTRAEPSPATEPPAESGKEPAVAAISDPILRYTAATALFQEVQFLNRYLRDAALNRKWRSYVVRLQINVAPFARDQPYDVYCYISFFADAPTRGKKPGNTPVEVIPLLVTDSIEAALETRNLELTQRYAAALGLPPASGALASTQHEREASQGGTLNSLLTIGRFSDNTLQVRLGAARRDQAFVMLPRNHNVTAVLAIADFSGDDNTQPPRIRVVTKTTLRDARTGKALKHPSIDDRIATIVPLLKQHFPNGAIPRVAASYCMERYTPAHHVKRSLHLVPISYFRPKDWYREARQCYRQTAGATTKAHHHVADELLLAVYRNDFAKFQNALRVAGWQPFRFERDLWSKIEEGLGRSEFSGARAELPNVPPRFPAQRPVLLVDDPARDIMYAELPAGTGLITEKIFAELILQTATGEPFSLPSRRIDVTAERQLALAFRSLAALNPSYLAMRPGKISNAKILLRYHDAPQVPPSRVPSPQLYDIIYYHVVSPKPAEPADVRAPSETQKQPAAQGSSKPDKTSRRRCPLSHAVACRPESL